MAKRGAGDTVSPRDVWMLFSRLTAKKEWGQSGAFDQLTGGTCKLERRVRGRRPWRTFRQMEGSWNWYLGGNQRRGAKAGVSQEMNDNLFGSDTLPGWSDPLKKLGEPKRTISGLILRRFKRQELQTPFMVLSSYLLLNIFLFYLTSCLIVKFCSVCVEFYELC